MTEENIELREVELELRETDDRRTVAGIAVPYNVDTHVNGYIERFERGAFDTSQLPALYSRHDHKQGNLPIGKVTAIEDREDGLYVEAQIAKTPRGDEAYELLREGIISKFSVGFVPLQTRQEGNRKVRTKARMLEISIADNLAAAYPTAVVTHVREHTDIQGKEINNETMEELEEIREAVSDLDRRFTDLQNNHGGDSSLVVPQFRTYGEFIQALGRGDENAQAEYRAYTGANTGDTVINNAWLNRAIRLVDDNRVVLNAFAREALPATGNSVEYPVLTSNSVAVAAQAAEGDDLTYGEVVLDPATATIKTYGGYSSLSFQLISRSTAPYLDTVYRAQVIAYAKATNTAVRAAVAAASGTGTDTLATDDFAGWLDVIVDGSAYIEDETGLQAQFLLVGKDVYKRLVGIEASDGRPLVELNGDGSNTIGSATPVRRRGSVLGLELVVDPGASANTAVIANSEAVTTWENGGPARLQDDNIINLTRDVSVYGLMAVGVTVPKAMVKLDVDLTP